MKLTEVGYTGGTTKYPTYETVCTGATGHAEAVDVLFDPSVVSYEQILDVFFKLHDPTQDKTRRGGGQYRSAIFYHNKEQEEIARKVIARIEKERGRPLATRLEPATEWNTAEDYHQNYYKKHLMIK